MSDTHHFKIDDAVKYGIEKAVLLSNIRYWVAKNIANNKHCHDGYYWTYNSQRAFSEMFPYMNSQKIGRLLREMERDGLVLSGNFNKSGYDRTKWFTVPSMFIVQNQTMENSKVKNGLSENEQPIPDINTDIKTDKRSLGSSDDKPTENKSDYPSEFEWIWERKPKREGGNPKRGACSACNARITQGASWNDLAKGLMRYKEYCDATRITGTRMVMQMKTFFGPDEHYKEDWSYEASKSEQSKQRSQPLTRAEQYREELRQRYANAGQGGDERQSVGGDHASIHGSIRPEVGSQGFTGCVVDGDYEDVTGTG